MPLPKPEPGLVVCYAYLWRAERLEGRSEGAKDRPCVIVVSVRDEAGVSIVTVVPITHAPPPVPEGAVEIPRATKRRLGSDDAPSWVVTSEGNQFAWPGPDLQPVRRGGERFDFGVIPPALFKQIR